jgi:hypothetical protein
MCASEVRWHVRRKADGQTCGPYTTKEVTDYLYQGLLDESDLARSDDGQVRRVGQIVDGGGPRSAAPPPPAPQKRRAEVQRSDSGSADWGPWCKGSIACAIAGFIIFPILFGPIAIVLAAIGLSQGEEKGVTAIIVAAVLTAVSMLIGAFSWGAMVGGL